MIYREIKPFSGFLPPFAGSQTPGSCHQPAPLQRDRLDQAARASTNKSVNRNLFGFLPGQARWELGFEHLHWCSWSLEGLTWESYYNHDNYPQQRCLWQRECFTWEHPRSSLPDRRRPPRCIRQPRRFPSALGLVELGVIDFHWGIFLLHLWNIIKYRTFSHRGVIILQLSFDSVDRPLFHVSHCCRINIVKRDLGISRNPWGAILAKQRVWYLMCYRLSSNLATGVILELPGLNQVPYWISTCGAPQPICPSHPPASNHTGSRDGQIKPRTNPQVPSLL